MALERHAGRLWVSTAGGPLLVVEEAALAAWGGFESGDYDRACATTEIVAGIDVGERRGLLLGDEPAMTAVVPRSNGIALVRWHAADDAARVGVALDALSHTPKLDAAESGLSFEWHDSSLIIFDSVETGAEQTRFDLPPGKDLGDGAIRMSFVPGRYAVCLGKLDPSVGSLSIIELRRV